jgi:DNA-binding SARP family transcriptional activator
MEATSISSGAMPGAEPGQMAAHMPVHMAVQIIGSLRIQRGATTLDAWHLGGCKPRQILEILLLQVGTPVSKDRLIELLWGGCPPAEARPSLESYVSVLRRNLQPGLGKDGPLKTSTGGYVIDRGCVDLDLDRFDALFRAAQLATPAEAQPLLRQALNIATGPLLGDELLPAWAEAERRAHAARVTQALILAAETAAALGEIDESIDWAGRALAGEPLNERAWSALILGLELAGRHAEGLHAYERCRRALDRDLGCTPGAGLQAAHLRLLRATSHGDGELSDLVSALLVLYEQQDHEAEPTSGVSVREAINVVTSFLRRAVTPA